MMEPSHATAQIKKFLLGDPEFKDRVHKDLGDGDQLISSGIIDSFGVVGLVAFLEKEFEIRISGDELRQEHFETIDAMVKLVLSKKGAGRKI